MPIAAVALNIAQAGNVLLDRPAQRAFDGEIPVDDADDLGQLLFGQFLGAALKVDPGLAENRFAVGPADTINVGEADLDRLVRRNVHT